jgi:hypothetical protein
MLYVHSLFLFLDINECFTGSHDCSNNAECVNSYGTFHCKCNAGFTGDGQLCHGNCLFIYIYIYVYIPRHAYATTPQKTPQSI